MITTRQENALRESISQTITEACDGAPDGPGFEGYVLGLGAAASIVRDAIRPVEGTPDDDGATIAGVIERITAFLGAHDGLESRGDVVDRIVAGSGTHALLASDLRALVNEAVAARDVLDKTYALHQEHSLFQG